jgi:hypothetical protein
MSTGNNTKVVVFSIVLAAVAGAGIVFCLAVLPIAVQGFREAARRRQTAENLRQLARALAEYSDKQRLANRAAHEAGQETKMAFDTYSGYFVSNKFEPNAAESFAVISDQSQFDKIFGVAMVMGDKSHRLAPDAFQSKVVLAVVKRGKAVWEFRVESVIVSDKVVTLRYSTTSKKSDSAEFAKPLIVLIPKVKYTAVRFVENNNLVKTIEEKAGKPND